MHASRIARAFGMVIATAGAAVAQPTPAEPDPDPTPPDDTATRPAPVDPPEGPTAAAPRMPPDPVAPVEVVAAPAAFTWQPFGYLRLKAAVVQNDPNVAFVGRDDGFSLQNARLGVRGALEDKAAFVVSIDGAVDERSRINSPDGKLRVGLRDAYTDFHLATIDLRAGRFDPVFDPDRLQGDTERAFVDRALESRGVRPTDGWQTDGLPPGRSLGVALRKELGPPEGGVGLGFEVAVQNGADEFSSDNDNDLPAASAAILARLPRGGVAVAAVRWNPRTEGDLPFRQNETDYEGAGGIVVPAGPIVIGAGVIVVHTVFDTTGGPAQNAYGGHAQLLVAIPGRLPIEVGYRFALLDPSDLILTDRLMEHTVGAVIAVPAWHVRAQLGVTHVMEQADRDLSNSRVEAALEVDL